MAKECKIICNSAKLFHADITHRVTKNRPYTVVVQFRNSRARAYLSCETLPAVHETIRRLRLMKDVGFIYYNTQASKCIVAYGDRAA
jgi:hypothetical protein